MSPSRLTAILRLLAVYDACILAEQAMPVAPREAARISIKSSDGRDLRIQSGPYAVSPLELTPDALKELIQLGFVVRTESAPPQNSVYRLTTDGRAAASS